MSLDEHPFADLLDVIAPDDGAVVAIRYVYMDESCTHVGSPVMAMAGYVFRKDQAQIFSREWGRDLERFGIPYGHQTDCATGNGHYKDKSLQERIDAAKALIAHTRRRSMFGVAVGVDYSRYREMFDESRFEYDAYTFALGMCVKAVHEWGRRTGFLGRFAYIFEAGHAAQAEANRVMNDPTKGDTGSSYISHTFVDKRDAPPLQAADMLAWQYAHHLRRRLEGHPKRRADFNALLRPSDRLMEVDAYLVDEWRRLMDEQNEEIIQTLEGEFPQDPAGVARTAAKLRRR